MEKILIYPAIFRKDEEAGYSVEFPDLPGCVTEGKTLEEAFLMAGDVLDCWFIDPEQAKPIPTPITEIKVEDGAIVQMIRPEPYLSEDAKNFYVEDAIEKGLEKRNLNLNEVAAILSVNRSYITRIINGKIIPSPEMAKRIGLLLGFDWRIFYADDAGVI